MPMRTITIATRNSPLALHQAETVRARLLAGRDDLQVGLLEIVSAGDKTLDAPLSHSGGKGLFLKELEQALLRGDADLAVHSMKDVTVELPDGLVIGAICARDDPRDAFVSNHFAALSQLPRGARVGTCSLRRQCQIRARFPHLRLVNLRGNINTRLAKLDRGEFDGIVLAAAGLARLGLIHRIAEPLAAETCLPAAGQGAIGIECRADAADARALIAPLDDADSALCVAAERAVNKRLDGGCQSPAAAYAQLRGDQIAVRGLVGETDGSRILYACAAGHRAQAIEFAHACADDLIAQGGGEILARLRDDAE
ncbi:MAG: hydroxymethylbilane synthase [bacterium]